MFINNAFAQTADVAAQGGSAMGMIVQLLKVPVLQADWDMLSGSS